MCKSSQLFHQCEKYVYVKHCYSMHDYSRDIMLATTQEQIELKMALNAAEKKGQVGINNWAQHLREELFTRDSDIFYS